uniref:Large polyvalent protein-associated domain-containing protein n=1 Tax=uncultured Elusimicrobia bacterium TaxID=699876 RepID=A0A650ELL6_9BACT|nr:hypothetical protein Elusimicrob1349_1190 [uncultured Elusimicrobia bacterium]
MQNEEQKTVWLDKYQIPVVTDLKRADEILYAADTQVLHKPKTNYFALADLGAPAEETAKKALGQTAAHALTAAAGNVLPGGYAAEAFAKTSFGRGMGYAGVNSVRQLAAGTLKDALGTLPTVFGQDTATRQKANEQIDKDLAHLPAPARMQEKILRQYKDAFSLLGPVNVQTVKERLDALPAQQKKIDEFNAKVKNITDLFTKRAGLDKTEKDGFIYDFGAGATSFLFSVGALAVCRNPGLVAPLFGVMEGQASYEQAIAAGINPGKAYLLAKSNAAWITATEMVGEGVLNKLLFTKGVLGKTAARILERAKGKSPRTQITLAGALGAAQGGVLEGVQEAGQNIGSDVIMNLGGAQEKTVHEIIQEALYAGLLAFPLGAGAGGVGGAVHFAKYAGNVKQRLVQEGVPEPAAQKLAHETALEAVGRELLDDTIQSVSGEINSPLTAQDRDPKAFADAVSQTKKQDFAKAYDEIETRAKNKFKAQGLAEEEAALGAAVERNITQMQAAHLGLTPELAEKSLDISFNQELSESDAKIRFIGEMQKMSAEEQEAFYKTSKMASYQEMLGELNAYRAGLTAENDNGIKAGDAEQKPLGMTGFDNDGFPTETLGNDDLGKDNGARSFAQAAAMYKSPHKEFAKFYEAAQNNAGKKQSYYTHTTKNGLEVDIPSDTILHDKKHPEMTAEMWEQALGQMDSVKDFFVTKPQYGVGADILLNLNGEFGAEITVLPTGRIILNTAFKSTDKGINAWIQKEKNARTPYPFVFGSRPHDLQKSPGKFPSRSSIEGSHTPDNKPVFMGNPNINSLADIVQKIKGREFNQGERGKMLNQEAVEADRNSIYDKNGNPVKLQENLNLQPITRKEYAAPDIIHTDTAQSKKAVLENIFGKKGRLTLNNNGEKFILSHNSAKKILHTQISATKNKLNSENADGNTRRAAYAVAKELTALAPEIFPTAQLVYEHADLKGVEGRIIKRYAAAFSYKGKNYLAMFVVKQDSLADMQMYDYQTEEEKKTGFRHSTTAGSQYAPSIVSIDEIKGFVNSKLDKYRNKENDRFPTETLGNDDLGKDNGERTFAQAAAMYRNKAENLEQFYNYSLSAPANDKSYHAFDIGGFEVRLPADTIKHDNSNHKNSLQDWIDINKSLGGNIVAATISAKPRFDGIPVLLKTQTDNGFYGVAVEIQNKYALITTGFKGTEKGIDTWIKKEQTSNAPYPFIFNSRLPSLNKDGGEFVGKSAKYSLADIVQKIKGTEFNQDERGKTVITSKDGFIRAVITAGQAADKSTFVHEMAHVYLAAFEHVYGMEEYAAQRKHLDAWLGQPRGGVYSRAQQEKFAQGFEQFLKEGKAPAPYLKSVFEKFRAWIIHVYNGADISKLSAAAREAYADMLAAERNDAQKTVEFYQANKKDYGRIRATLEKIKQDKLDIKDLDGVDLAALRDFVGILKKPAPALPKRTLLTDLRRYGAQYANSGQIDKEAYKNARVYDKATGVGDKPADWLVKHGYMEDADVQTYEEASARDQEACELIERALAGEPVYKLEDRERVELHDAYREAVNMAEDAIGADYKNYEKLLESLDALKQQGYRAVEKSDLDFIQEKFEELANLRESEAFLAQEESFGRVDDAKRGSADERRKDKTQKAKLENLRKAQGLKKAVLDELERRNLFVPAAREQNGKLKNELPPDAQPVIKLTGTEIPGLTKDVKTSKPAVLEWFKNALAPLTSKRKDLGEISYPVSSAREVLGKTKETEKIKLLPAVKAVVDNGILLNDGKMQDTPNHTGGVVGFYYVQGAVDLDGKIKTVQVDIAQDRQGKKFYFYSEIKEAPIGGDTLSITRAAKGANNTPGIDTLSITRAVPKDNDSITKNNDIFKAPAKNKLTAVRDELNRAKTVEEIYKAADRAFLVMEEAYGNTEAGKAEAGRLAPPAQDWDARRVELLKDLADINKKTDANAAWAFAAIERGGLIAPHKSGLTPQEWNAPAAVSDKQRKINVWKAEQILDEQLRNRYYKAFEKALGSIEGLKGPQKSMLLREFNNIRYRNKNAPELIVKTLESARQYVDNNYKNYIAGKIEEIVKTPLFEKSGSLRTAKYSPAAQAFLKAAHRIVTLDKETARDSYARAVENQNYDEALSKTQILQNKLLQLKAAPETMTPAEVKDVYGQMREIQKAGRDEVRLEKFLRNTREDIWRERLLDGLEKQKMPKGAVLYIKKLANWQSILNTLFGEIEVDAEVNGQMGKEKIKFMDALSLEQNQIQMQNHVRALRQKVVERVGEAYGLKNGNDYIKKINELQSETYTLQNYGKIPEGPAELLTERQKKPFLQTITKLELLFFYIQDQNPLNRARLMRAYRQEQYETLFAPITAQDKKAAAALMQIAQSTYEQMNEVHKRERGFTLGRVENYFPNRTERLTGGLDYLREMLANNAAPSAIKARVQTVSAVEKPVNPVSLLMSEISRNAEYIYGAESAGKLRRIFRDEQMARALEEKFGKKDGRDIYEHLIKMIDLNGPGARSAEKKQFFEKMEFLFNNWVKSAIGLKPIVAIKQFASAFNYTENMPVADWTAGFKDALLHPRETLRFMREFSPYLVTRYEEGGMNETLGRALAQDEMFGTADKINTLTNAITVNVRLGDMFALAFGGKPYADWLIKEKGYSRERAREAFELATVRAQQANLKSTLNEAQLDGGNLFWRAAWAFRNQQMQYARKLYDAYVDYVNGYIGEKDMAKKVFMYAVVQPALYTLLSLGWFAADDDDRKDDWWRLAASPVEQTLGAVPFGDDAAELLFNNLRSLCEDGKLTGLRAYELPGVADMYRTFNKLVKNFNSGDADLGDWLDAAAEMGQFSGFGTKQIKTQISGLYDAVTGKPVKGAMKVIGYTQNRANKVTGEKERTRKKKK